MRRFICITSIVLASLSGVTARAATALTAWTFDNLAIGNNSSPAPSTGLGAASAIGLGVNSNPDVQSLPGSSTGLLLPNAWRVRATGGGNAGWSTNAPIGTQGAQFAGSTFGYYKINVSFDVYATPDAEANLQVQYSTDGHYWYNANIVSAGSGTIATNTSSTNTVNGTYIKLASGWNNQVTVDLSGISGVDNDTAFAVRMVNASTGADCVDTTGAVYNNTSGSWTLDNVVIQGSSIDVLTAWNFDLIGTQAAPYNSPAPTTGSGTAVVLGMTNHYTFSDSASDTNSLAWADVTAQAGASTGAGSFCWRVRGGDTAAGVPNSGWNSQAPLLTQGAEFNVDTSGYTNIIVSFDIYFTTQAPDRFTVLYTTDGWATSNIANNFFYGANPNYIFSNSSNPDLVQGTYFYENFGQGWYNNVVVDLTGVTAADNNPLFGFRVVNAGTGPECVNYLLQPYNNLSGNLRFDNVMVGGTFGTPPPTLVATNATVDSSFTVTFTDNPTWRANISAINVNGLILTNTAYSIAAGQITFNPAKSALLQKSGLLNISVLSHGFGTDRVPQPLAAGVTTKLATIIQAAGPSASGGTLILNPVFLVSDKYGNGTTNPYQSVTISAAVGGAGGWTLGGNATQTSVNGLIGFTNLTATVNGSSAVSNAYIAFTVVGYSGISSTNSATFNIGVPPVPFTPGNLAVLQVDTLSNNTTFSMLEVSPSAARQTAPVNIVPISATGTNALRLTSAGSTGRLALSDDGTLVVFAAFADGSAATPDETLNLNRSVAALNSTNKLTILGNLTSVSFGGSEARAACVLGDDTTWIADDKGGLYQGSSGNVQVPLTFPNLNNYNNVVVRTFGGNPWVETQKAVSGLSIPMVYELGFDMDTGRYDVLKPNNLGVDQFASDFYMISTNGGASYDILYIADQISSSAANINKYSFSNGLWVANGFFTNSTGVDGLFATTNGNGGVNLFYTTGSGGSKGNSLVRVTDASGWNQSVNIISSNVLYTATSTTALKGLTFVPQGVTNAVQPIPPPVLTAQNGASVSSSFTVTNSPSDQAWHNAITSITVDGSPLPSTAYNILQPGKIVFDPTKSTLLQGSGPRNIVVSATGYSADAVVQSIAGVTAPKLGGFSLSGGQFNFTFTSTTGLSFAVLATNNLAAPHSTWPAVGTAVESPAGSGHYQFSDPNPATNGTVYYRLRQP